jgi:uncharacterized protein (TIGR03382 family)
MVMAPNTNLANFSLTITGSAKDGITGATNSNTGTIGHIPAPGALALLGLAGVAGSRRRRA